MSLAGRAGPARGPRTIGDLIEVPPVRTVIRLEEGRESPAEIAGSFVFTSEVRAHLSVIAEALTAGKGQGYFLQGDFGSGKSHFLAALFAWLSGRAGAERLSTAHEALGQAGRSASRILPVAVSLIDYRSDTALESILLEAVERALAEAGREVALTPLSVFLCHLKQLLEAPEAARAFRRLAAESGWESDEPPGGAQGADLGSSLSGWIAAHPREAYAAGMLLVQEQGLQAPQALVEDRKATFQRVYRELEAAGFSGLVLLIDELSEFLRSKPTARAQNEDARTLQFLGELSQDRPLWIVAAVQESIESTGDIARGIIRKIKDRYPVKLALSTVHIRALVSERLVRKKPGAEEAILGIYEDYRRQFATFDSSFEEFRELYPVHPATIALLDGLGELFSQHRGIVDFVCSRIAGDSRRGIPSILERPQRELLGPDSIFEHFSPRLAEFSSYNIYPRHIVPHLDREIDRVIPDGADRHLARRIVRMLVLYRIHPTAEPPDAARLAELAACSLDAPELSARFVAEALLDPLAAASRFLRKRQPAPADPTQGVYEISTEEDSGKVLEARIRRLAEELAGDDSRLLSEALLQLPESDSWPGPALGREGTVREVNWQLSQRRALVRFLHPQEAPPGALSAELEARGCDFALLLTLGALALPGEAAAVFRIPMPEPGDALETLKEYLAVRLLQGELSPGSPADAPLIAPLAERAGRLKPAAAQAALEALYSGGFADPGIRVDAAVRQLKRFDSLLEAAGRSVLAARYPRFAEVAPRNYNPSPRMYQQLLESFVIPGSLPVSQARQLGAAIDGLAFPLGLVEVRRSSYVFSPDLAGHPLLASFFELLRPSGAVALPEVMEKLTRGAFGLPRDTALFLVASLAAGGLITVRRGGRAVALELLNLQTLERAEEIALGELIGEHDRVTLIEECRFLSSTAEAGSFGLRQQRDAWKEVVSFRGTAEQLAADALDRLSQRREYSSFRGFPFNALEEKLRALGALAKEIRVSYPAKEGLEKFLAAWRASGLEAGDIQLLKGLERFLRREAEKLVFVHHYLRHEAVEKAAGLEADSARGEDLQSLRRRILELIEDPLQGIIPDEGAELDHLFSAFRERYLPLYAGMHKRYYEAQVPPTLSKQGSRALESLRRLAGIEALDRPPGLDRFLLSLASPRGGQCGRQVREELMRAPVCGCGFLPGQAAPTAASEDPQKRIDRYLQEYLEILRAPAVLEALAGHGYAVRDLKPTLAARLEELAAGLRSSALSPSVLVGTLEEGVASELAEALRGSVTLRRVDLQPLIRRLAGRRLPAETILSLVGEWLGRGASGELIAVDASGLPGGGEGRSAAAQEHQAAGSPAALQWWALANAALFPGLVDAAAQTQAEQVLRPLEEALERRYPARRLAEALRRLPAPELEGYIRSEPLHTRAVQAAWQILAERVLKGEAAGGPMAARQGVGPPAGPPAGEAPRSRHADPVKAARIDERLCLLAELHQRMELAFPGRLAVRPVLASLLADPWSGAELQGTAAGLLRRTASLGDEWLSGLPPVRAIDLEQKALVLLVDGVPPDLWLDCMDLIEAHPRGLSVEWARLETEPLTLPATASLLGLEGDPLEALEARGVPYLLPRAREEEEPERLLGPRPPGKAMVVRLGTLDREAHQGAFTLAQMAEKLRHLLETRLPALHDECLQDGRRLILTTDHGLSLSAGALSHGAGGVYERAIFRACWSASGSPGVQ